MFRAYQIARPSLEAFSPGVLYVELLLEGRVMQRIEHFARVKTVIIDSLYLILINMFILMITMEICQLPFLWLNENG